MVAGWQDEMKIEVAEAVDRRKCGGMGLGLMRTEICHVTIPQKLIS